jgi:activator of 2-hydroxyglutaryl-CoA dehydratase
MKKNISGTTGKKLETAGKNKMDETKLLTGNVRMLVHKLEQVTPAVGRKLEAVATTSKPVAFYIGIDLGDKKSNYCVMDEGKEIRAEDKLATTREEFTAYFSSIPRSRIALKE